jgi:competence protein ComEA
VALFSRRDRIAIAVIAALILAGWGVRLLVRTDDAGDVRVIRGAVAVPAPTACARHSSTPSGDTVPPLPETPSRVLRIDINRAGTAELERLPMIGPVKAVEIVRYRKEHGPFAKPSDLMKVRGVGLKTYGRIERLITVGGSSDGK